MEQHEWVVSVIGAHGEHRVKGRKRLQKSMWLLQRLGLPTDYGFTSYLCELYSADVRADLLLMEKIGAVTEEDSGEDFAYIALDTPMMRDIGDFVGPVKAMESMSVVVLELAATYDWFRYLDYDHEVAIDALRRMKSEKWEPELEDQMFGLLEDIGLLAA